MSRHILVVVEVSVLFLRLGNWNSRCSGAVCAVFETGKMK